MKSAESLITVVLDHFTDLPFDPNRYFSGSYPRQGPKGYQDRYSPGGNDETPG